MENSFDRAAAGIPAPELYFGAIVEQGSVLKIEWNDPVGGRDLLTEEDLLAKEESSRMSLIRGDNPAGSEDWKHQRNTHYSAEYALEKLQQHKLAQGRRLDTPLRPVIPN